MINKKIYVLALVSIIFSSCSMKDNTKYGEFNQDYNRFVNKNYKKTQNKTTLKNSITEIIDTNKNIEFDNAIRLSTALDELAKIDNKTYILAADAQDIFLKSIKNSYKLNINSFEKLNEFIQDTSNNFIYIERNKFKKNRIKIVNIKNKEFLNKNLENIPFVIEGSQAISHVLEEVSRVSNFSIITKNIGFNSSKKTKQSDNLILNDSLDKLFESKYVSFTGSNIMELLDYISNAFNVYVNIDYKNKTIVFEKIKSKIFHIGLNNIKYSGSLDVKKDIQNDVGKTANAKSIKTKIKLDILDSLDKDISYIVENSGVEGSLFSFNKTTGEIFIDTDKDTMNKVSSIINNFNDTFKKQIDFELEIYEFAVTKDFNYGINFGVSLSNAGKTVTLSNTNSIITSLFRFGKQSGTAPHDSAYDGVNYKSNAIGIDSKTKVIRLLKHSKHGYIIKNSIPYIMDVTTSKSYVKTISSVTTNNGNKDVTTITPKLSEINEGTIISVLGKINANKIEFNIQPSIVTLDSVTEETYSENKITLPSVSTNTFKSNIVLSNGDKRVIGYLTSFQDVKDYNGVVPIENFIIGGANSKKYFRKETVFVVSAKIKD